MRSAASANAAASPPFIAAPPTVAGAPSEPEEAASTPLGENEDAGDAAALGVLPAAAPAAASAAAVAATQVPEKEGAVVVAREASRASTALALCSLALESRSCRSISFLRHCSVPPVSRTSFAFQKAMSARLMAVSDKDLRAAAVVLAFLQILLIPEFCPWDRDRNWL